ncbi:MAG: T9SS type A sorting domain-containing protein [Candidatus Marinimicrobia bacterium]|nr:T9SS type A sorting domain-containing protein [Candidatus Neomarinimicrobiota bacterium]
MKKFTCIPLVLWIVFSVLTAQTAADYHLPLQMGNGLVYRSGEAGSTWAPRTEYETIEGTDSIHGNLYYKLVGSEIMDDTPSDRHISHAFWLREDSLGNVLIIAIGLNQSTELDSAMVYPMAYPFFRNEILTPGYSLHYEYEDISIMDSTISNTETVMTPAGTFYNCIKMRQSHYDSLGNNIWLRYGWYAEDVGEVMYERITPNPHTSVLTQINFQTAYNPILPDVYALEQNYPNPFNPLTMVSYSISAEASMDRQLLTDSYVEISVYDIKGQKVASLVNEHRPAGYHKVLWNATNYSSGIYICTMQTGNKLIMTKKMLLIK